MGMEFILNGLGYLYVGPKMEFPACVTWLSHNSYTGCGLNLSGQVKLHIQIGESD